MLPIQTGERKDFSGQFERVDDFAQSRADGSVPELPVPQAFQAETVTKTG